MKKLINSIKNKFNKAVASAKTAVASTSGEGYIDTGVKIIIGVVIGLPVSMHFSTPPLSPLLLPRSARCSTTPVNQKLNRSKQRRIKNQDKERTR